MELSPGLEDHMKDLAARLFRGERLSNIRYFNTSVTGPGVEDTYDPDIVFQPNIAAGFWPGGILGDPYNGYYAAVLLGTRSTDKLAEANERQFLRRFILESKIGAAALERYRRAAEAAPDREVRDLLLNLGSAAVPVVMEICAASETPFSYLVAGTVRRSQVIPVGHRVAALYYPAGVPPGSALANLRREVRRVESDESR